MKTLELRKATAPLNEYVRHMGKGPVVFTAQHKPIAALILVKDTDLEDVLLSTNPKFMAMIERSRARHQAEGGISSHEMRRRLGLRPKPRGNGR